MIFNALKLHFHPPWKIFKWKTSIRQWACDRYINILWDLSWLNSQHASVCGKWCAFSYKHCATHSPLLVAIYRDCQRNLHLVGFNCNSISILKMKRKGNKKTYSEKTLIWSSTSRSCRVDVQFIPWYDHGLRPLQSARLI